MTRNPRALHEKLSWSEYRTILQHFSNRVDDLDEGDKRALRRLPFYEATHGGHVSLDSQSVCVVPIDVPRDGMEVLQNVGVVFFYKLVESLCSLQISGV